MFSLVLVLQLTLFGHSRQLKQLASEHGGELRKLSGQIFPAGVAETRTDEENEHWVYNPHVALNTISNKCVYCMVNKQLFMYKQLYGKLKILV